MAKRLDTYRNSFLKWSVAILLLAIPLYPKFPLLTIPGSQVALRLEDILLFIISICMGLLFFEKIISLLKDKLTLSFSLFWLVGLVSLISGIWITQTASPLIGLFHWARRIEYMTPFFIGILAVHSKKEIGFYIKCLTIVIIFSFIYGVGQKYFEWPIITTQNSEYAKGIALQYVPGAHLVSTFAGHYDLSSFLVMTLPLFVAIVFATKPIVTKLNIFTSTLVTRFFVGSVTAAGLWLLVNAAHRISFVSYLGSASLALILTRRAKFIPLVIIISIMFLGFSSNLINRYTQIIDVTVKKTLKMSQEVIVSPLYAFELAQAQVPERRNSSPTPEPSKPIFEDRSTSIRLNVEWPRAIRAVTKNPLLGTGYSSLTLATDNDYLRMLGETGVLGFIAFMIIVLRIFIEYLYAIGQKITLPSTFVLAILASLPGIALNMVFIDILEASKFAIIFWLMIGISVGLARNLKYE